MYIVIKMDDRYVIYNIVTKHAHSMWPRLITARRVAYDLNKMVDWKSEE